jgi:hypothetical protein
MPDEITSRLVYPNPFQPTGIEFELQADSIVTVKIINDTGKDVETLIDHQRRSAGKQVVSFDAAKYKTGQFWYSVSIEAGGKTFVESREIR